MNAGDNQVPSSSPLLASAILGAHEVLQRATSGQWELSPGKWSGFDACIITLADSLASGDAERIRQSAAQLERMEPRRITRLGGAETAVPMPEPTRERLNEVVHRIDRLRSGTQQQADDSKPPPGPGPGRL